MLLCNVFHPEILGPLKKNQQNDSAPKLLIFQSFIHVSTTYSNCTPLYSDITEEFYPPAYDYKELLEIVRSKSDEELERITPELLKPWVNTYSFTKQVAESIIQKEGQGLPVAVFRPGIGTNFYNLTFIYIKYNLFIFFLAVVATYKEPLRSWTDNIYGPSGYIYGVATGVLRVILGDPKLDSNFVPVDMTVNALITSAAKVGKNFRCGRFFN